MSMEWGMAQYFHGNKSITRGSERIRAILEILFPDNLFLLVFPGRISQNDIWIKYIDAKSSHRLRTPKHIHWVLDILVKREHNRNLVNDFLNQMLERWDSITPLPERTYDVIINNLMFSRNTAFVNRFNELNRFGFWDMDFITHLIELLMLQEKTNNPNAYMFVKVVKSILDGKDPYIIVSHATMGGGKHR